MTPMKQVLSRIEILLKKIDNETPSEDIIGELIDLKEQVKKLVNTEKQNLIFAWDSGKYLSRHSSGEEYYVSVLAKETEKPSIW